MEQERLNILFKKHIEETLLPGEAKEMQNYIASPAFKLYFQSLIAKELESQDPAAELASSDVNGIVEGIESKVLACINKKKTIPLYSYGRYAAVAAGLILVLSIFLYWSGSISGTDQKHQSATLKEKILPGTNRATLQLSDGRVIALSEQAEGIIADGQQFRYENGTVLIDHVAGQIFTLTVPRGGKYKLKLSDGTQVWLNAASSITYPAGFAGSTRQVKVTGEAYFQVAHDRKHPFLVEAESQNIKVLGTEFNVNTYNHHQAVTTLIQGSIALRTAQNDVKTLIAGDQAILAKGKIQIRKVDVQDYIGWKDNVMIMDDQDVNEILEQLERWYDVKFINADKLAEGKRLSGEIPRDSAITTILHALEIQLGVKFEIDGRKIIIKFNPN